MLVQRPRLLAFQDVERGEHGDGTVALVVVGHMVPARPLLHRQGRLGPIEGLDLALLVDRKDDGAIRGIDIEADNILEPGCKGGSLENLN